MEINSNCTANAISEPFKFKYVAEEELLRIVRKVRREKQKERDALLWKRFVEDRDKIAVPENNQDSDQKLECQPSSCCHCKEINAADEKDITRTSAPIEFGPESIPSEIEGPRLPFKRPVPTDGGANVQETGTLQRIVLLRQRISIALDSITGMIQCQPAEPDGPDDLERRKTRLNEFLSRFSRNYLFQFQRQVAELRKHVACASTETPGRHTELQALMQKLVSAHQTAVQSLQAYLTQIPSSLQGLNIFGKLRTLLHHLCDLSSLKSQLDIHAGIIEGFEDTEETDEVYLKCKELLRMLEEKRTEPEDISLSARASSPLSARGSLMPRTQQAVSRTNNGIHRGSWKQTSSYLARAKFGPPSSVRSSVSAHVSSRGRNSHKEKKQKDTQIYNCCNSELKEIITHMHDVLCNKVVAKKKKKSRHVKSIDGKRKSSDPKKPLTQVQNLSNNVQLVITQHCDSDTEGYRDAATDTADFTDNKRSPHFEGDLRKSKRVGWATAPPSLTGISNDNATPGSDEVLTNLPDPNVPISGLRKGPIHNILNYRQRFSEYNSQVQSPFIQRLCEDIIDGVFQEISEELEPSFLLEKMYHLEFKDV
ncbi:uncharacterized protein LOC117652066 isoform X2 [Thrips palmi]|uniref:Uncharacterized protein LOC117652066 isoform X2 n=1 Tax=Thrips palmi TaxID=161013 RepID=A0A6P9A512_THRPL|nr:uncharacterized protein LOC117652066 isoform X2 [Thrips palmi]